MDKMNLSGSGWALARDKNSNWISEKHLYTYHAPSNTYKRDDDEHLLDDSIPGNLRITDLPNNAPSFGFSNLEQFKEADVCVPGTVDEYLWAKDSDNPTEDFGRYTGVSWWWRSVTIPNSWNNKRIVLSFNAVSYRAEIFIGESLVRYDAVSGTPFDVDITDYIHAGETFRLAVRVTNPGGNMSWDDNSALYWGQSGLKIFPDHGFSGITGDVTIFAYEPVYINDIYIENTPNFADRTVNVHTEIVNSYNKEIISDLKLSVLDSDGNILLNTIYSNEKAPVGTTVLTKKISVPQAKLWDIHQGNLYTCRAEFIDSREVEFGFRWFTVHNYASDPTADKQAMNAHFYLNGRRIRILSATSWGFWPVNGVYATPEMAEKNARAAIALGMNTLYHHRHLGSSYAYPPADRLGLLTYCEMGGIEHAEHADDSVCKYNQAINRQKVLRAVRRDRNHPCVITFGMVNEAIVNPTQQQISDMDTAHNLAPDKLLIWTSGTINVAGGLEYQNGNVKSWYNSGESERKTYGYIDLHGTNSPQGYWDNMYQSPTAHHRYSDNKHEVKVYGEEGAVGSPGRFDLIKKYAQKHPETLNGWDAKDFIARNDAFESFLQHSGMNRFFTVNSLLQKLGEKTYYIAGKRLECFKIADANDMYVVNGWENDKSTSLSGMVDLYRNLKCDDAHTFTDYSRSCYPAVKLRNKNTQINSSVTLDIHLVNEGVLWGDFQLYADIITPEQEILPLIDNHTHTAIGNDVFSQLLESDLTFTPTNPGEYIFRAQIYQNGIMISEGKDTLFAVDYKSETIDKTIQILDSENNIATFLKETYNLESTDYNPDIIIIGNCNSDEIDNAAKYVFENGGRMIITLANDEIMHLLEDIGAISDYKGMVNVGNVPFWLGGSYFNGTDSLFDGLPQNCVFNAAYQVFSNDTSATAVNLPSAQALVGAWAGECNGNYTKHISPMTAMFAIQFGKGTILVNTLPAVSASLVNDEKRTCTVKKLFVNMLTKDIATLTPSATAYHKKEVKEDAFITETRKHLNAEKGTKGFLLNNKKILSKFGLYQKDSTNHIHAQILQGECSFYLKNAFKTDYFKFTLSSETNTVSFIKVKTDVCKQLACVPFRFDRNMLYDITVSSLDKIYEIKINGEVICQYEDSVNGGRGPFAAEASENSLVYINKIVLMDKEYLIHEEKFDNFDYWDIDISEGFIKKIIK